MLQETFDDVGCCHCITTANVILKWFLYEMKMYRGTLSYKSFVNMFVVGVGTIQE